MKGSHLLVPLALVLALLSACAADATQGYTFASAHSEQISSVAVPIFDNPTFERGIDVELTEAVVKEIQRTTGWVITSRAKADTILEGRIIEVDRSQLSRDRVTGLGQELAITITIDFEWKSAITGEVLVGRRNFAGSGTFVPTRAVGERYELGRAAAIEDLAKAIVDELRSDW
jgi:hypothetical protein